MRKYQVVLSKSYLITINADSKELAKRYSEYYTGDIKDISTIEEKEKDKFNIEEIECGMNEAFDVIEIKG